MGLARTALVRAAHLRGVKGDLLPQRVHAVQRHGNISLHHRAHLQASGSSSSSSGGSKRSPKRYGMHRP